MFVSVVSDPTSNSEISANGGNKQIMLLLLLLLCLAKVEDGVHFATCFDPNNSRNNAGPG